MQNRTMNNLSIYNIKLSQYLLCQDSHCILLTNSAQAALLCGSLVLLQPDVPWGCSHLASVSPAAGSWACKVAHPHGWQLMRLSAGSSAGAIKQTACAWLPQQAASGNWTSHVTAAALKASIPRNSGGLSCPQQLS